MRRHERGCLSPLQQGTAIHPLTEAQGLSCPLDVNILADTSEHIPQQPLARLYAPGSWPNDRNFRERISLNGAPVHHTINASQVIAHVPTGGLNTRVNRLS